MGEMDAIIAEFLAESVENLDQLDQDRFGGGASAVRGQDGTGVTEIPLLFRHFRPLSGFE